MVAFAGRLGPVLRYGAKDALGSNPVDLEIAGSAGGSVIRINALLIRVSVVIATAAVHVGVGACTGGFA